MHDLEHHSEDSEESILLPSKLHIPDLPIGDPPSKRFTLVVLGLSVIAAACACTSYITSASIYERRDASGLRQPNQHPGLEFIEELKHNGAYL